MTRAAAVLIDEGVPQNCKQPSLRIGSFLVLIPGAECLEHRLLHQVVGVGWIPAEAEGDPVQHIEVNERLPLEAGALLVYWRRHVWGRGVGHSRSEKAHAAP